MTETMFTPGPWADDALTDWLVDTDGENAFTHIGPKDCDPVAIAIVPTAFGMDDVLDANTALIAAAPELYEALEELESIIDGLVLGHLALSDIDSFTNQPARAALAKARGEQS